MTPLDRRPIDEQSWAAIVARNAEMDPQILVKRGAERYDVPFGQVTVYFRDEPRRPFTATLMQVSLGGLMLRTFDRIPSTAKAALHILVGDDECVVHASAVHCTDTVSGYKVGFQLEFHAPAMPNQTPAAENADIPAPAAAAGSERGPMRRTLMSRLLKRPVN
jgi:hypothetical protein